MEVMHIFWLSKIINLSFNMMKFSIGKILLSLDIILVKYITEVKLIMFYKNNKFSYE
jgi:hypothetical protein